MHSHSHRHHHNHHGSLELDLKKSLVIILFIFFVELIGGFISGSLALLSDAVHMLSDSISLLLVLGALLVAKLHPSMKKTFGYHRLEVLVSVFNGLLLLGIVTKLFFEALERFNEGTVILTTPMIITTAIGLFANLYVLNTLKGRKDVSTRSAVLHVFSDTAFSFIVLITGIIIAITGFQKLDSIATFIFVPFIAIGSLKLLYESLGIMIEFAPRGIDLSKIIKKINSTKGVTGVHGLHVWAICPHINILTAHIQTNKKTLTKTDKLSKKIKSMLKKENIKYSTLQFEYSMRRYKIIRKLQH